MTLNCYHDNQERPILKFQEMTYITILRITTFGESQLTLVKNPHWGIILPLLIHQRFNNLKLMCINQTGKQNII